MWEAFLGDFKGKLLSDGYEAYASYSRRHGTGSRSVLVTYPASL